MMTTGFVRWLRSIPVLVLLSLILGGLISIAVIPEPKIGTITISDLVMEQSYADDIMDMLRYAGEDNSIKAVVLEIDCPGGSASAIEQVYLDVLRLRQKKPVVVSIGPRGASGGYHIAVASDFIYAQPTSILGNIGALVTLPKHEKLDEDILTTGPFKATGASRRKITGILETLRQQFVSAVISQRGYRLKLSEEELSRAEIYTGTEGLRYGLIDDIGTSTVAIEKAANLAGLKNYGSIDINEKLGIGQPVFWFFSSMEELKSRTGLVPAYYYLYFESR